MSKSGLKAFVYSFSVSLFAIIAANRAFWHAVPFKNQPLDINGKNIILFLKNNSVTSAPVKKIALNTLPDLSPEPLLKENTQAEVILADTLEEIDFPLELDLPVPASAQENHTQQLVLADVLYAPDIQPETPQIDAAPIYTPDQEERPLKAPPVKHEIKIAVKEEAPKQEASLPEQAQDRSEEAVLLARAATADNFPLQKSSDAAKNSYKINIGNPKDLNDVALSSRTVSIHSMEKDIADAPQTDNTPEWKQMNDNPWVVARSNGVSRNKLADKDFADKTDAEIAQALNPQASRPEIKVASETVKNLIIPIPGEIMKDENLTPKLAYPSTSEDAEKERAIDKELKKQEKTSKTADNKKLLSPIDEEVELDAPAIQATPITKPVAAAPQPETKSEEQKEKAPDKGGIMNALNSIFTTSQKTFSEAKEKAIAKAQAKRSFRKRLAKDRPVSIMPTEIKLSFQPNRAEISGQTLRWVQAFASKAAETPDIALEIRIDGNSSVSLQQKRLNLLHNILTNKGVEHGKINTVFTTREPNSFILRTVNLGNNTQGINRGEKNNRARNQHIQW